MKHIDPATIVDELQRFDPNIRVTKGVFEFEVPGLLQDMEWNHMDQMHRPFIHDTYRKAVRVALGNDFAISLTQWQKIPLFITVTDVRIKPGLYYQCMTIAGLIYVHININMREENEVVYSKLEWHITSHKWLKFLHKPLHNKLVKLNTRLQIEDNQIRVQRYALRKSGYRFASDPVDYLSSNVLRRNTIYPDLMPDESTIDVTDIPLDVKVVKKSGAVNFLIKKTAENSYAVWPAACPHEGGDLSKAKDCDKNQLQCPWHGLRFSAILLSAANPAGAGYGFEFQLQGNNILVHKTSQQTIVPIDVLKAEGAEHV